MILSPLLHWTFAVLLVFYYSLCTQSSLLPVLFLIFFWIFWSCYVGSILTNGMKNDLVGVDGYVETASIYPFVLFLIVVVISLLFVAFYFCSYRPDTLNSCLLIPGRIFDSFHAILPGNHRCFSMFMSVFSLISSRHFPLNSEILLCADIFTLNR